MLLPEYSITNNTLKNISNIEYAKSLIENTTLLPNWQKQLVKDARARTIYNSLLREGINVDMENIKRFVADLPAEPQIEVKDYENALKTVDKMAYRTELNESDIKKLYECFNSNALYRNKIIIGKVIPDEILAEVNETLDWYTSLDAKETHPLIVAAIFKAQIEYISPFETGNYLVSDLATKLILKMNRYDIKDACALEEYYVKTRRYYEEILGDALAQEDYTRWIEYFTEGFSREISMVAENVKLLARDTKIAKAAGEKVRLSERQEKIVEYLQDFGMLQNKDFGELFPRISEDTVLRELKGLIRKGIIAKRGRTKSSRYELV